MSVCKRCPSPSWTIEHQTTWPINVSTIEYCLIFVVISLYLVLTNIEMESLIKFTSRCYRRCFLERAIKPEPKTLSRAVFLAFVVITFNVIYIIAFFNKKKNRALYDVKLFYKKSSALSGKTYSCFFFWTYLPSLQNTDVIINAKFTVIDVCDVCLFYYFPVFYS